MKKYFLTFAIVALYINVSSQTLHDSLKDTIQKKFMLPPTIREGKPQDHFFAVQLYVNHKGVITGYTLNNTVEKALAEAFAKVFPDLKKRIYKNKVKNGRIIIPIFIINDEEDVNHVLTDIDSINSLFEFNKGKNPNSWPVYLLNPIVITYSTKSLPSER